LESIGRYSAAIYRLAQSIFNVKLRDLEIGSGQYDFFLLISRNEGISQKELCDSLYVEKSTTAKAVKHLVSKGYVDSRQIENDKRYSSLYLTDKGRAASAAVETVFADILDVFYRGIPDTDAVQTIGVMKRVIRNLQEEKATASAGGT
jgi:DNA-binding MarR family transcriptional regulator